MSYEIYLVDNTNSIKLDTDNIDMTTTFAVADITDLNNRKDTITKTVTFKKTKTNKAAFGNLDNFNRVSSTAISNKLGFNYNPLRPVDCIVYEDGKHLVIGSIRVIDTTVDTYQTVITGKFIDLKSSTQDKYLTDIDFTDLKHRYSKENIKSAWGTTNEVYNPTTHTYSNVTFQNGSNYVYPYIDYAQKFLIDDANATNSDHTVFHALNFRPAVFVKEYFKRILAAAGWTFEVKGSSNFLQRFAATFVPHSAEKIQYNFSGFNLHFQNPSPLIQTQSGSTVTLHNTGHLLRIDDFTPPTGSPIAPFVTVQATNLLVTNRNFNADSTVQVQMTSIHNPYYIPVSFTVQLVERPASTSTDQINDWQSISELQFALAPFQTIASKNINLNVGSREYSKNTNLAVRIFIEYPIYYTPFPTLPTGISYNVNYVSFDIPKNSSSPFTADINLKDGPDYDIIAPTAPENIKQMDFLKSVMALFNLYAYTEKADPTHLIFETYDDYYTLANREIIVANSLDWTKKVKLDSIRRTPNLTIPKSYTYTYKDDGDWLNSDYKTNFGITFGTFQFTDGLGVVDSKKIELIFSPTPIEEPVGTQRKQAGLYSNDNGNTKPLKTNIRILYYNGVQLCTSYRVLKDLYTTAWTTTEVYPPSTLYPQATTYFYDSAGKPIEDLNFGRPNEYYFPANSDYTNVYTAFETYYSNQVTELTNVNIWTVQADVWLNEIDISNLDLRVPVFIDFGENGHSYFKVLSVEYQNNKLTSKVILQQIYLGTLS